MENPRIVKLEWGALSGRRPRLAGSNARLGEHGLVVRLPILRVTTEDGASGFGACRASREQITPLLGMHLDELFSAHSGVREPFLPVEYALWDLAGKRRGQPVYALAAEMAGMPVAGPLRVPCYDTSLYFDDLSITSDKDAADLIAQEARDGYERGHRAFKIKVGRGAYHLPLEQGTARDIMIVHAVRDAVGPALPLMLDANNGYNLNLTERVLAETADCQIFWIEEPFHEDHMLYGYLRKWLAEQALPVLIADGEGLASPLLLDWARDGLIDVIQYDIFSYGFTRWLALGRQLDAWNVRTAPHHYGGHYGNYAACHLAAAIQRFTFVEWDEVSTPGLDASGYTIQEGHVNVPATPGFGLALDEQIFSRAIAENGFVHSL